MKTRDAAHDVIEAVGKLKACYPQDSEESEALNSIVAAVVDLVYGGQVGGRSDEQTKAISDLLGKNAHKRLKLSAARNEISDTLVHLLEKNALLDELVNQVKD